MKKAGAVIGFRDARMFRINKMFKNPILFSVTRFLDNPWRGSFPHTRKSRPA